ncbi:MAG: radical SAM protein [bacterium]
MPLKPKTCLINPPTTREQDEIFFPMGLVVLGTLLKEEAIPVEIVDFDLELRKHPHLRNSPQKFEEYALKTLRACGAEVFGIGSICSNFPNALSLAKAIRKKIPQTKIVLGGPQPSSVPQKTLECFSDIDVVVVGEGEKTLLELLQCDWNPDSLKNISGICFHDSGKVHTTPARPLLEDLDELPLPDFSLVDLPQYFPYENMLALIEAGRGCPFRCSFCSTAEMWSRKYRAKSPGRILEEMRILHRDYQKTHFNLTHDNFTTSPKYIRKFCDYFIEHNQKFTWSSSARTDTLKPKDLENLKKAGCKGLFFGVDSGSSRVQKAIDKHLDLEEFKEILSETVSQGIGATTSFVLGFPDETRDEIDETISLGAWAKRHGATNIQYHRLAPLAGTKIYNDHKGRLEFNGLSSDMSVPVLVDPEIVPMMKTHPDLFSSFHTIPTPQLKDLDMLCLTNFFTVVVNKMGPTVEWLFEETGKKPTDLFSDWLEFTHETSNLKLFSPSFILDSFRELL